MKRPVLLILPLLASALLFSAGPDEPKVTPAATDVDLATAQPGSKPACTSAIAGHQWPDEAADPHFAAALAPYGYPMICTRTGSTYVWRSAAVPVERPKKIVTATPIPPRSVAPKN